MKAGLREGTRDGEAERAVTGLQDAPPLLAVIGSRSLLNRVSLLVSLPLRVMTLQHKVFVSFELMEHVLSRGGI